MKKPRVRSVALALVVALPLVALTGGTASRGAGAADNPFVLVTHEHFNSVEGPLTQEGDGTLGESTYKNPPSPICSTAASAAANVNTDCEGTAPHNETTIAVNPTNPLNMIASANDYQLVATSGGTVKETIFSRAHVTFDGGKTWTTYPINYKNYIATGDPAVAFDASGTAYLSTLGFLFSQGRGCCTNPDVLVAHSTDSGKT